MLGGGVRWEVTGNEVQSRLRGGNLMAGQVSESLDVRSHFSDRGVLGRGPRAGPKNWSERDGDPGDRGVARRRFRVCGLGRGRREHFHCCGVGVGLGLGIRGAENQVHLGLVSCSSLNPFIETFY